MSDKPMTFTDWMKRNGLHGFDNDLLAKNAWDSAMAQGEAERERLRAEVENFKRLIHCGPWDRDKIMDLLATNAELLEALKVAHHKMDPKDYTPEEYVSICTAIAKQEGKP